MSRCRLSRWFILAVMLIAHAAPAWEYRFEPFLFPDAAETVLYGINSGGVVVGAYGTVDFADPLESRTKGFIYDGEQFETLEVPGALSTSVQGINDDGVVVGEYFDPLSGRTKGFLYDGMEYKEIVTPFAADASAADINNDGIVVGSYSSDSFQTDVHGFRYDGSSYQSFEFPRATRTFLEGSNNVGQEVGTSFTITSTEGFVIPDFVQVEHPSGIATSLTDINDAGIVTGTYLGLVISRPPGARTGGFLFDVGAGTFTELGLPGVECAFDPFSPTGTCVKSVTGINNSGTLVGYFDNNDGVFQAFVGTPIVPGDVDQDGDVDGDDLLDILLGFGTTGDATLQDGDANGDGVVDRADVQTWRSNLRGTAVGNQGSQSVPEVTSFGAALASASMLFGYWLVLLTAKRCHRRSSHSGQSNLSV